MGETQSLQDVMARIFEKVQIVPADLLPNKPDEEQVRIERAVQRIPARYRTATTNLTLGNHGVYLWGPVGTGKTHTAAALALQGIHKGLTVRWVTGSAWLASIRASFNGAPAPATPQELAACDLLVIDDLGAEKPSE